MAISCVVGIVTFSSEGSKLEVFNFHLRAPDAGENLQGCLVPRVFSSLQFVKMVVHGLTCHSHMSWSSGY